MNDSERADVQTLRAALPSMHGHEPNCPCSVGRAHAALDSLAAALREAEEREERLREALDQIARHGGANEYDDCQDRREGEKHGSCKPVILGIARAALAAASTEGADGA